MYLGARHTTIQEGSHNSPCHSRHSTHNSARDHCEPDCARRRSAARATRAVTTVSEGARGCDWWSDDDRAVWRVCVGVDGGPAFIVRQCGEVAVGTSRRSGGKAIGRDMPTTGGEGTVTPKKVRRSWQRNAAGRSVSSMSGQKRLSGRRRQ